MRAKVRKPQARPPSAGSLVRPLVRNLQAYVPGEQPRMRGLIKLNTNENPYPPAPQVIAAIRAAADERLRRYPHPTSQPLREKLAKFHRCSPGNIIVGNGSDELLALATRTFVEPMGFPGDGARDRDRGGLSRQRRSAATVQFFSPSYSLYPVLSAIHGALTNSVRLTADFTLPALDLLRKSRAWDFNAALTFVTTPNAPSGSAISTAELRAFCRLHRGVVVLDEAYVDFAEDNALCLALEFPHVLVSRTFSKAYSLCFQRVGYFVGHPEMIAALDKLRDSYNVNGLGQVGALATLDHLGYYRDRFRRVKVLRQRLTDRLGALGFEVVPSQANFIFVRPPVFPAEKWHEQLRSHKILVRWFADPAVRDYLRITVGTDVQIGALLRTVKSILSTARADRPKAGRKRN